MTEPQLTRQPFTLLGARLTNGRRAASPPHNRNRLLPIAIPYRVVETHVYVVSAGGGVMRSGIEAPLLPRPAPTPSPQGFAVLLSADSGLPSAVPPLTGG